MDVDMLLPPLVALPPCGEDMAFSSEFDQIAEMRRADDPSLDQGAWVTPLKHADWPGVVRLCTALLRTRTRDLRLALWLTEARALSEGPGGLAEGLAVCAALCARHWPELHPRPEAGDMEERIGNIAWLLQRIVDIAPALPVTQGRQGERFSLRDLAHARLHDTRTVSQPHPGTSQPLTAAQFHQALADSPAAHLRLVLRSLRDAEAALLHWQTVVDAHLGPDGPSFVAARDTLAGLHHGMQGLLRELGLADAAEAGSAPEPNLVGPLGATPSASEAVPPSRPGPPRTRVEALRQLREVAAYFRQTEPHSPVAYLADKAVRWGEMPLHLWLREVVKDGGAMAHLQELLGFGEGLPPQAPPPERS